MSDSSDSSEDQPDDPRCRMIRKKRELPYGAFAQALKSSRLHGASSSSTYESMYGNPRYGDRKMLFCRTGWFLRVGPGGQVEGTKEDDDDYALIKFSSAGQAGHVYLMGLKSKLYLAFNKRGQLYGEPNKDCEETVWLEELLGSYNTYMSRAFAHLGWYMALKRSGKFKKAQRTGWGQKAIQFLTKNIEYES